MGLGRFCRDFGLCYSALAAGLLGATVGITLLGV
jgi:hypothetical protein